MTLLLRPRRHVSEGPKAYRLRVLQENLLPGSMGYLVDAFAAPATDVGDSGAQVWLTRQARWCPTCLRASGYGRIGWELRFADACAGCGNWLVDICSGCGQPVRWNRDELMNCRCGADLREEAAARAPDALVKLSRTLEQRALKGVLSDLPEMRSLNLEQCCRLIRLLGTYGGLPDQRQMQKVRASDALAVSWPISTAASEILISWPHGFHWLLKQLHDSSRATDRGRVVRAFGGLYRALYSGLGDVAFDWVREAFEDFLAAHWSGALGRQNRRTADSVLGRLAWMPASAAASALKVSNRRIRHLIDLGQLRSRSRMTASGRQHLSVHREDVENLLPRVACEMSLEHAADQLGISRHRLARLLPHVCPEATKVSAKGSAWAIPMAWMDGWHLRIANLPIADEEIPASTLTFDRLLRYWPVDDLAVSRLLADFENDLVRPIGRLDADGGLSTVLFSIETLRLYRTNEADAATGLLSIPEVAQQLGIKQEVAYAIVNRGLLSTSVHRVGRRNSRLVRERDLEAFRQQFVLARDLAARLGRSPKVTIQMLDAAGLSPVMSPGISGCRQTIYRREDLAPTFPCLSEQDKGAA